MSSPRRFSCYLIGTESLLIACGEMLLEHGHDVRGVISSDQAIARWARARTLQVFDPATALRGLRGGPPFDYLLSITNLDILPAEFIALPLRGSVNFHDGPLPRYGGLFAPVWALIDRQASHGITWHVMNERADSGAIVEQRVFDIAKGETSFSLNTKCYAAGIETFPAVIESLSRGLSPKPATDLDRATYHKRADRPRGNCAVYWSSSAEEIAALARALDFGSYPNPFGLPRIVIGGDPILAPGIEATNPSSNASAGTVVSLDAKGLTVATSKGDVVLTRLLSFDGEALSPSELASRYGLTIGTVLAEPDAGVSSTVDAAVKILARNEPFWTARLSSHEPASLPYTVTTPGDRPKSSSRRMEIPDVAAPAAHFPGVPQPDFLAAAFAAYVARLSGQSSFDIDYRDSAAGAIAEGNEAWIARHVPLRFGARATAGEAIAAVLDDIEIVRQRGSFALDVIARNPALRSVETSPVTFLAGVELSACDDGRALVVACPSDGKSMIWHYNASALSPEHVASMQDQFAVFLNNLSGAWSKPLGEVAILGQDELSRLMDGLNATEAEVAIDKCVHELIEQQVSRTPDKVAVVSDGVSLTYSQLDSRANKLAQFLRKRGVGPEVLVGICLERSADMMVALLGTHKAGGAYVPLDPAYPAARLAFMLQDANVAVLVTRDGLLGSLPETTAAVVCIDRDAGAIAAESEGAPRGDIAPHNLAYVIYTSGSTGTPKGVMVEHRSVVNFFAGMDDRVGTEPGVWLAVTSLSFDISVLELFWTLARGFTVVIHDGPQLGAPSQAVASRSRGMEFSLFYFSADEGEGESQKYRLLLEGARFADRNGFSAVWTPERHFHAFGGLYPNPAVTGAAVAAVTERVSIRAGSCVIPLHHPLRVAEEWSVVDNISGGRVGISFAAGWQPNDFVLRPENFSDARNVMLSGIETVRKLWRGEPLTLSGPTGKDVTVKILPRPIQPELPFWLTTAGNPASFEAAGKLGANLLTHLLGQSVSELGTKLALYRKAWKESGHQGEGHVSLMLHTFVGKDDAEVKEIVRRPMMEYLRTSISLIKPHASAFPTFRRSYPDGTKQELDFESLTPDEMESLLEYSFERYYETSALFGTLDSCARILDELKSIDVDEIACLIDFGVDSSVVLDQLVLLNQLRAETEKRYAVPAGQSIPSLVEKHAVTHMQCTPSLAAMLLSHEAGRDVFRPLKALMIGGEAFPVALANTIQSATTATIHNMYGPTETTIWSTTYALDGAPDSVPIGRPVANTQLYVVDANGQLVPAGVPGELLIGGAGVVRGYLNRPDLTAERFIELQLTGNGRRVYRTGDLVRYRADGNVDFLGRIDHQVKIRGFRIELGEIESALERQPYVREAVVTAREDAPGDKRLVAYIVPVGGPTNLEEILREKLKEILPEHMLPSHFVVLDDLPRTPNAKIDRKALPAPLAVAVRTKAYVPPKGELEQVIAGIWQEILKVSEVGVGDNFFDLGGHSLLAVQVHGRLTKVLSRELSITDLFRFPTIRSLAGYLGNEGEDGAATRKVLSRAEARRQSMIRRAPRR